MRNRRKARELALQVLYQTDIRRTSCLRALNESLSRYRFKKEISSFCRMLIAGTERFLPGIDALIQWYAKNWTLERMTAIDRNILRLSIYELLLVPKVPPVVSINEAVEIAKRYGTDDSGKFINGILDRIRRERVSEKYLQWSLLKKQLRQNMFLDAVCEFKGSTKSYLVGGFIRNTLCGVASNDMDIVIDAPDFFLAEQVAAHYGKNLVTLDETVKRLSVSQGSHLDFTLKKMTLEIDLAQRDFTIDALALDLDHLRLPQLYLTDLHGGLENLVDGTISLVGEKAIDQDPLRMFRAFRLECQLHFKIDSHLLKKISAKANLITSVARERVRSELLLILDNQFSGSHLTHQAVQDTLEATFAHPVNPKRLNYLEILLSPETNMLDCVRDSLGKHLNRKVGTTSRLHLLKLLCLSSPRINSHYEGTDITSAIGLGQREQRAIKKIARLITLLQRMAGHKAGISQQELSSFLRRAGEETPEVCLGLLAFDQGDNLLPEAVGIISTFFKRYTVITKPLRLIRGDELSEILSVPPGPALMHLLNKIHEAQIGGEIDSREQAIEMAHHLVSEVPPAVH